MKYDQCRQWEKSTAQPHLPFLSAKSRLLAPVASTIRIETEKPHRTEGSMVSRKEYSEQEQLGNGPEPVYLRRIASLSIGFVDSELKGVCDGDDIKYTP
jgi:hypothetical protein